MTLTGVLQLAFQFWAGVFCLITAAVTYINRWREEVGTRCMFAMQFFTAMLLVSTAIAWGYRGSMAPYAYVILRISNFGEFFFTFIILGTFTDYLLLRLELEESFRKKWRFYMWHMLFISIIILVVNQWIPFGYDIENNLYHREHLFLLIQLPSLIGLLLDAILLIHYRRNVERSSFIALGSYLIAPVVAALVEVHLYGYSLLNLAIAFSMLILFIESERYNAKMSLKSLQSLHEMQVKIMLSQIQPHFLYNSLNAIYYLVDIDQDKARTAISDFSDYLRMNLDSLRNDTPVPFDRELEHVRIYLSLEKMRFDDDLEIVYDIQTKAFTLPALTVQPIVENAVKYGLGKKDGGGRITIRTEDSDDAYRIIVHDDGVGYDIHEVKTDGRSHIGIDNVRQRIEMISHGSLEISSAKGMGTTAVISIPKPQPPQNTHA